MEAQDQLKKMIYVHVLTRHNDPINLTELVDLQKKQKDETVYNRIKNIDDCLKQYVYQEVPDVAVFVSNKKELIFENAELLSLYSNGKKVKPEEKRAYKKLQTHLKNCLIPENTINKLFESYGVLDAVRHTK